MPYITYPRTTISDRHDRGGAEWGRRNSTGGFTVVELLIVVVILAIAALTAVPMMSSASSMQIRSATSLIMADLEYAKSMAISRGQDYSVHFDVTADRYQIEDQGGTVIQHPVKTGLPYVVSFSTDSRLNRVDITSVNFNGNPSVEFDCLGSPVGITAEGTVTLQAGNTTATVTVEPVTGYISSQ